MVIWTIFLLLNVEFAPKVCPLLSVTLHIKMHGYIKQNPVVWRNWTQKENHG
jgi:hypothetical protein